MKNPEPVRKDEANQNILKDSPKKEKRNPQKTNQDSYSPDFCIFTFMVTAPPH